MLTKKIKNLTKMFLILFIRFIENENVITKNNNNFINKRLKDTLQEIHEHIWGISEIIGHNSELVVIITSLKGYFRKTYLRNIELMVAKNEDQFLRIPQHPIIDQTGL